MTQNKCTLERIQETLDVVRTRIFVGMSAAATPGSEDILDKCQKIAGGLAEGLEQYAKQYLAARTFIEQKMPILPHSDEMSALSGMLAGLSSNGKKIMLKAVQLHHNLLKLGADS